MTIEKLPSGSYRISQAYQGKRYRITVDHKPSKKEATILIAEKMAAEAIETVEKGTLEQYANKYISEAEKRDLSPSTIRSYESIKRNTDSRFLKMNLFDLNEDVMQEMVDNYYEKHSPKSVSMYNGFWHSVISSYRPKFIYSTKLPKREKKAEYEPTTSDVMRILENVKGTEYSIPLQLAVLGLRRGEIYALTLSDLDNDNILTINKDLVHNKDNKPVIKNCPKTSASNRRILIPDALADEIRENGKIYEGNLDTLNKSLHKAQKRLGIPRFRLHMLRHFAAAYLHKMGFTDAQILEYGGWESNSNVMQRVYRYNLDPQESQKDIANVFSELT